VTGSALKIEMKNLQSRNAELEIYNIKGQLVFRQNNLDANTILWNGIDNKGMRSASGIYFLKVKVTGDKPVTRKILVL